MMRLLKIFLFLLLNALIPMAMCSSPQHGIFPLTALSDANIPESEYLALVDLYDSTDGANWRWSERQLGIPWNITENANPCTEEWEGVICTNFTTTVQGVDYRFVTELFLPFHNLQGTLPESIGNFTQLIVLHMGLNELTGTLPSTLGNLTQLQLLNVSENHWMGTIPASLGNLVNLQGLDLSGLVLSEAVLKKIIAEDPEHEAYGLNGTIPESFANLQKLTYLSVGFNELTGTPAVLGNLTAIEYLFLYLNLFSGTVPTALQSLRHLRVINIGSNFFTGDGHNAFMILQNNVNISSFVIDLNFLSGTIPEFVGESTNLTILDVSYNNFTGTLPESIGNLTKLMLFNVANNMLSGTVPHFLSNVPGLVYIDMIHNNFLSTIPEAYGALTQLQFLDLGDNAVSGTIPESLGNLKQMLHFNLGGNYLRGTIPAVLGQLTHVYVLDLDCNYLSGTIPSSLGALANLQFVNLSDNSLTGRVPEYVSNPQLLATLDLSFNRLQGTISSFVGYLSGLQYLYLQNNLISGSLPQGIANLTKLESLMVQYNRVTGQLTGVFNSTTQRNLTSIQLGNNQLTGQLPDAIFELPRLKTLVAVVNCFHGSLPLAICDSELLTTLALDGLQSASTCQQKILPRISNAYIPEHSLHGGIPACLFGMPSLRALHLSGNGLTGSLPDDVTISPALLSLTLSNNILTGSIPRPFQEKAWFLFDLSFNHLCGELLAEFAPVSDNASVSLQTNRLSGKLPSAIIHAQDISILSGNIFSCDAEKNNLPRRDSNRDQYVCGSTAFNAPYYVWLISITIALLTLFVLWRKKEHFRQLNIAAITLRLRGYYDFPSKFGVPDALSGGDYPVHKDPGALAAAKARVEELRLPERLRSCRYISELLVLLCQNTLIAAGFVTCVLLIYFPIASPYYSTHENVYAYKVSAAYVSGTVPFAIEFVLFSLFLLFVLALYRVSLCRYESGITAEHGRIHSVFSAAHASLRSINKRKVLTYGAYFVINFTVVLGVNIAFIYVSLYENATVLIIAQILLSVFKLVWSNLLTFYASIYFSQKNDKGEGLEEDQALSRVFYMQLFVMLLNNIAIPCLVVAAISPGCFYNVFIPPPQSESHYQIQQCVGIVLESGCNLYTTDTATVSYDPPFSYSYQCSSSFIRNYAPAFLYMCFTATFVVPFGQELVSHWHRSFPINSRKSLLLNQILQYPVLSLRRDDDPAEESFRWRMYFNANQILLNLLTFFGVLMTFGVVFPPLAVALAFTVCFVILYARIKVGYFLSRCVELNQLAYVDKINAECTRVVSLQMIRNSVWMLIAFSACFYTLFLFDTLGDAVGYRKAYWVLIVMPLLPAGLYIAHCLINRYLTYSERSVRETAADRNSSADGSLAGAVGVGIVLNPIGGSIAPAPGVPIVHREHADDV